MSSENDRDLEELRSLPRTAEPPPELEDRVVRALAKRGSIARPAGEPRASWRAPARRWALAASLLLALLAGWFARDVFETVSPFPAPESQFMVLLSEPRGLATAKPIPELVAEYRDWALELAAEGRLVSAARLRHDGIRLAADRGGELRRRDEDWRLATGYFVIRATSYDEAAQLVADCPHLAYGGEISLRQLAISG